MRVLVTGSAGFIGSALSHRLLARGDQVIGLDNVNDYYEVSLKEARLAPLKANPAFTEARMGLEQRDELNRLFEQHKPERVVNLAAQAGVRYSLKNPHAYMDSNIVGFCNILEACRYNGWSIWSTPPAVRCTGPTPPCRSRCTTTWTIP